VPAYKNNKQQQELFVQIENLAKKALQMLGEVNGNVGEGRKGCNQTPFYSGVPCQPPMSCNQRTPLKGGRNQS